MEHIGVCIILLDKSGKQVLLGKQLNSYKAGMLGLPGGRIELDESLEKAAARELAEETSLDSSEFTYQGVVRDFWGEYNFIHFIFVCKSYLGEVKNVEPEKCEGWEWYPLNNLPENILPGHKAGIKLFLEKSSLADLI